jgi:hypothetical protein
MGELLQPTPQEDKCTHKIFPSKEAIRLDSQRDPTKLPLDIWNPHCEARINADDRIFVHRVEPEHRLPLGLAESMCNKLTFLYRSYDAQLKCTDGTGRFQRGPCAAIWSEWLRCHTPSVPNLKLYFAKNFMMRKKTPTSIPELLKLHRKLCNLAEQATTASGSGGYKLSPLCRALMVVLDQEVPKHKLDAIYRTTGQRITQTDSLELFASEQNLLLVRTGDEGGSSAPIDFTGLAAYALPRARSEIPFFVFGDRCRCDGVRVPLAVAVVFLHYLQHREETARPDLHSYLHAEEQPTLEEDELQEFKNWVRI